MKRAHRILVCLSGLLLWSCHGGVASASLRIPHPDDASKHVEYFLQHPGGKGPWPTVILLHGHQEGARPGGKDFVDWGVLKQLAARGYLAVAVSQPGYGNSSGPPDFCGPFTEDAVEGVIDALRKQALIAPGRIVIEGISRGALVAGLVAERDPQVAGLVLISGVYDLASYVDDPHAGAAKRAVIGSLAAESGGGRDALLARSVLPRAREIRASVLILNGAKDDRTEPAQAQMLADEINRGAGQARAIVYPEFGHQIPVEARAKEVDALIDSVLGAH